MSAYMIAAAGCSVVTHSVGHAHLVCGITCCHHVASLWQYTVWPVKLPVLLVLDTD